MHCLEVHFSIYTKCSLNIIQFASIVFRCVVLRTVLALSWWLQILEKIPQIHFKVCQLRRGSVVLGIYGSYDNKPYICDDLRWVENSLSTLFAIIWVVVAKFSAMAQKHIFILQRKKFVGKLLLRYCCWGCTVSRCILAVGKWKLIVQDCQAQCKYTKRE